MPGSSSCSSSSDEPLGGRWLGDAPHLHPGALLLLPAGAVGATSGPAAQRRRRQAHGGKDQEQQQHGGGQAGGQQEVRGRSLRGQLAVGSKRRKEGFKVFILRFEAERMWQICGWISRRGLR